MMRYLLAPFALTVATLLGAAPVRAAELAPSAEQHFKMLDQYCAKCHNATDWAGGVAFDTLTPDSIATEGKVWEETVRKMRGRLMPPPGEKQPPQHSMDQFVSWMEGRLDAQAQAKSEPGLVGLHRINRTEYARVVQELLGLKVNPETLLPKDTKSEGFDNVANVLRVSPTFLDQYISAARTVSVLAVGDPKARSASQTSPRHANRSSSRHRTSPVCCTWATP